jgi:hypothetical protein
MYRKDNLVIREREREREKSSRERLMVLDDLKAFNQKTRKI